MRLNRATIVGGLAALVLAGGSAGIAAAAVAVPAHTYMQHDNCANGIYAGYDGTQVNGNGQAIVVSHGQLEATDHASWRDDACFTWFSFAGNSDDNKIAEFSPDGVASNEVMAAVRSHHGQYQVELQQADGSPYQQWNYNAADNGTWTNAGTDTVLAADGHGRLFLAPMPTTVPENMNWAFQAAS